MIKMNSLSSRKGAPYYSRLDKITSQMENMGIIQHWMDEVIKIQVKMDRNSATRKHDSDMQYALQVSLVEKKKKVK